MSRATRSAPTRKILVCDDSATGLSNLRAILADLGHHTISAHSAAEAVGMAISETPALILMDLNLRDLDGYETCRRLQADRATRDIPLVLVSSRPRADEPLWSKLRGARALLARPCSREQLAEVVRALA